MADVILAISYPTEDHTQAVCRGLAERGIKVPDQVSVVGFDNIFASALVTPGLTTVAAPLTMLGDSAVRYVTATLTGHKSPETCPVLVPVRLIVRQSTAPAS